MQTTAVRMHGVRDLRLATFELPPITADQILAKVVCDSICMSTYKAAQLGAAHHRVPATIATHPVIVGHEFCGEILIVGAAWREAFAPGQRFALQPALNYRGSVSSPGYSYPYLGGAATYVVIPAEVMEMDCLLPYDGETFFMGALAEPLSCVAGAFHSSYHTLQGDYQHRMGIKPSGTLAILGGCGPMGLAAIDYALHAPHGPRLIVVTDRDAARLRRAAALFGARAEPRNEPTIHFLNPSSLGDPVAQLRSFTGGAGFDDVLVMAAAADLVEQGDQLLGRDGCLNFFAGPTDPTFSARLNLYAIHYSAHHHVGSSGGSVSDMREVLDLCATGVLNPAGMVTHIGGLDAVVDATLRLPDLPGGKKLIYTHHRLPLVAVEEFAVRGQTDPFFAALAQLCAAHDGLWNGEAEQFLLKNAPLL